MVPHVITNAGLQVVLKGQHYNVASTVKGYKEIVEAIYADHESEEFIIDLITATQRKVAAAVKLSASLTYNDGAVYHHGEKLRGYAISKLIGLVESNGDVAPLANFLTKVQGNPDFAVVENLYEFLEKGNMPLTPSGDFLAYKAVRADWKDIHSNSYSNVIGSRHSMQRNKVDSDRNNTCSNGFHVCSFDYLPNFAHADGHVVICQINPADVVAVPTDYNNTKMRVSSYLVIGEVSDYYSKGENFLASKEIWDETYTVYAYDGSEDGWGVCGESDDFEEAVEIATEELDWFGVTEVKVTNSDGVMVFYKKDAD